MSDFKSETHEDLTSTHSTAQGLSLLREHTKNVMIPLLIKVFQIRLEAQQIAEPPSRLSSSKPKTSLNELIEQLTQLDEDLKLQYLWVESTRTQIKKIITELPEIHPVSLLNHVKKEEIADPAIQKSFHDVISKKNGQATAPLNQEPIKKKSWIRKFLSNKK